MSLEQNPLQAEGFGGLQLLLLSPGAMAGIRPTAAQKSSSESLPQASLTSCPTENGQHCLGPGSEQFKSGGTFPSSAIKMFGNEWALCAEGDQLGFGLWRHLLMVGMIGFFKHCTLAAT